MRISFTMSSAALAACLAICAGCGPGPAPKSPRPTGTTMADAFAVVYGKPAPYATLNDSGDHVVYTPQALLDVTPGVVALVSKSEIPDGCKGCAGALTISYLKRDAGGFSRLGSWPAIGGKGLFGKALPWSVRTDLDDGQTLVTRNEQKDGGCSATLEELITLRPLAPVKIATVVVANSFAAVPGGSSFTGHVTGRIVPLERGKRFAVVLSGTESGRETFVRQGDVFTAGGGGAAGC